MPQRKILVELGRRLRTVPLFFSRPKQADKKYRHAITQKDQLLVNYGHGLNLSTVTPRFQKTRLIATPKRSVSLAMGFPENTISSGRKTASNKPASRRNSPAISDTAFLSFPA